MVATVHGREIELDFIRGLAILLVLDYHFRVHFLLAPAGWLGWPLLGYTGVDLFFVLSGFLVGGLLIKEWVLRAQVNASRFLVRRGLKIWPQYYVFLLINLVTGHRPWAALKGNFLNVQNYTGGIAHTWTLAVEEHAYLLLGIVIPLAARFHMRPRRLFALLVALALLALAWSCWLAQQHTDVFPRTEMRLPGILLGVLLAMLYHRAPARFRWMQEQRGVLLLVVALALVCIREAIPRWWIVPLNTTLTDLGSAAALLLLYPRTRVSRQRSLPYRLVAWIGLYSYGIYLWHVAVSGYAESVMGRLPGSAGTLAGVLLYLAGAIGLGVLSTKLIEFPFLALRDRLFPRRIDSAAGVPAEVEERTQQSGPVESEWVAAE